ncbi:MAG: hypothetical protein Q9167_007256 [Letrouitia subvulpina]
MNGHGRQVSNSSTSDSRYATGHGRQVSNSSISDSRYGAGQHAQIQPSAHTLLNGYGDELNGLNGAQSNDYPKGPRSISSRLLNSQDPVSMHLLMETALGESQHFEVLSIEELDEIKKEIALVSSRIDATKRKLVIETKLRDAHQSINRLDSPSNREITRDGFIKSQKGHRRSIMGSRGSMSELLGKHDDELSASGRKCEDMAQELWKLEKRLQELQKKLLEHTAGVLQVTHSGYLKSGTPPQSSDGLSSYVNGRGSGIALDSVHDFDDRSFYQTLDSLLEVGDDFGSGGIGSHHQFARQNEQILDTERRIEDLNRRLKESIGQVSSSRQPASEVPVQYTSDQGLSGTVMQNHLDLLEKGIDILQADRNSALDEARQVASNSSRHREKMNQYEDMLQGLWGMMISGDDDIRQADQQRDSSGSSDPTASPTLREEYTLQNFSNKLQSLFAQATHLREQKDILTRQIQQQRELNGKSDAQKDAQISELTAGFERTQKALEMKETEAKEVRDELVLVTERLDATRQEATLKEQQRSLTEQSALNMEKQARKEAEESLLADLQAKEDRLHKIETELTHVKDDSSIAKAAMRAELEESERRIQESVAFVEAAKEEKARRDAAELTLKQQLEEKVQAAEKTRNELKAVEGEMVRLQTELTVARAELDGAYGTRAQRAAEVASNPAVQKELEDITMRNKNLLTEITGLKAQQKELYTTNMELEERKQALQSELTDIIGEYESMTKASIEFERDREVLESSLDSLRDRCEDLETQLREEKLESLGVKSPGSAGHKESAAPGSTSATVLRNEFKKMMREMRAENTKALRLEQEERRKLESLIRTLRRDQMPGKSSLNQTMTAQ